MWLRLANVPIRRPCCRSVTQARTRRCEPLILTPTPQAKVPQSFVLKRGRLAALVDELTSDMRKVRAAGGRVLHSCSGPVVRSRRQQADSRGRPTSQVMEPYTAVNLKERKDNKLKDFIHVAGPLGASLHRCCQSHVGLLLFAADAPAGPCPLPPPGVSHFLLFSATERSRYLRIAKSPRGPTLTWRVAAYSHTSDVASSQAHHSAPESAFRAPPLVVLNNFGSEPHMKLAALTFQNLFPPINVNTVKLASCQRVLLVDFNKDEGRFRLRHYAITARQAGVNRRLRRLLASRDVPDLGGCNDVAEWLTRSGNLTDASDSEGEEGAAARVTLAQPVRGPGNAAGTQSSIRLKELGPRMDLELLKVEEGLCGGAVLYHSLIHKSAEDAAALELAARQKAQLKEERRTQQEANVARKQATAEAQAQARQEAREARQRAKAEVQAPQDQETGYAGDGDAQPRKRRRGE